MTGLAFLVVVLAIVAYAVHMLLRDLEAFRRAEEEGHPWG